ncbi:MAG: hypothetical protein GY847_11975 [Proteobacteria bacterium]|nr:hypothetical protein [Pseudomonadota bacterium]
MKNHPCLFFNGARVRNTWTLLLCCILAATILCAAKLAAAQTETEPAEAPQPQHDGFPQSQHVGVTGAIDEKAVMEMTFGKSLNEDYRIFIHQRGINASFIDYWYDKLNRKRRTGIILTAVVTPSIAVVTGALLLVNGLTSEDGMSAGFGAVILGFGGGICALSTLIPGIVLLAVSNSRLRRMAHLRDRDGRHYRESKNVTWNFEFGLNSIRLVF